MNFTPEQHAAIHLPHNLVVTAGAGSGKTRVLVERYLRLFLSYGVDAVLAITFTEKAAREMRERVRHTVEERARAVPRSERAAWEEHRAAIESARIGTIHSFCAALLRAHPAETGLDPQFSVLDEVESAALIAASVDEALAVGVADWKAGQLEAASQAAPAQAQTSLFMEFGLDDLRAMLVPMLLGGSEVRRALADMPTSAPALQAHWHARLVEARHNALAVLRARSAWQEAAALVKALAPRAPGNDGRGQQVRAVAAWLEQSALVDDPALLDFGPLESIRLNVGSKKLWPDETAFQSAKTALATLRECYRAAETLLKLNPDPELEARAATALLGLRALYALAKECYTAKKAQRDALDFDDLECRARALLEEYPAVRRRWQAELRAVLVDEFQDTNDEQRAIIYALTGLAHASEPHTEHAADGTTAPSLFVVGDGKQSIYRFRGADVSVFRAVAERIVQAGGQAVHLDVCFRAHPPLVEWINRVGAAIFARTGPARPYEFPFEQLRPHRPAPPYLHCVELHLVAEGEDAAARRSAEAQLLATRIKALVAGEADVLIATNSGWRRPGYGDIALLFQASTVFDYYEQALRAAGIPFLTTAGRGFYGRKEVQDLIHLLRVLDDPHDELALVGVLRSPLFALDDATILHLRFANPQSLWDALLVPPTTPSAPLDFARDTLRQLHALRGQMPVVQLLRTALAETGYLASISGLEDGERRRVNVEKLLMAARMAGVQGIGAFRDYLDSLLKSEPREGEAPLEAAGSVQLMTVHRSKGLEFPIVVLPDLGRRSPNQSATWLARRPYGLALQLRSPTGEQQRPLAYQLALAEEQRMEQAERERLLYVALTRARDYLLLSGPCATRSGSDWLSWLVAALGYPWEQAGPPAGDHLPLRVFRYG